MRKVPYKTRDVEFKRKVIVEYLGGCESVQKLCAKYEISASILSYWKKQFEEGRLDKDARKEKAQQDKISQLERKVGQQAMEIDFLKKANLYLEQKQGRRGNLLLPTPPEAGDAQEGGVCT